MTEFQLVNYLLVELSPRYIQRK